MFGIDIVKDYVLCCWYVEFPGQNWLGIVTRNEEKGWRFHWRLRSNQGEIILEQTWTDNDNKSEAELEAQTDEVISQMSDMPSVCRSVKLDVHGNGIKLMQLLATQDWADVSAVEVVT